jgi:lantibiotic biosynthesis dehydratase-like protein
MQDWQNLYVYYTDVDRLMVECLHSALVRHTDDLKHCYWERHYAGGPHIRVHLCAWPGSGVQLREAIAGEIESYIASHPSEPQNNYSPETVKKLLAMEEEEVPDEDLKYHVNVVLRRPEGRPSYKLASEEASELLADFFHDSMGLAVAILKSKRPKLDEALRLYFVEAIFAGGTLPDGAVSFKSHWEGLAAFNSTPALNQRIMSIYAQQRETILEMMLEVKKLHETGTMHEDPILSEWDSLLRRYHARATEILAQGKHVTFQFSDSGQVEKVREKIDGNVLEDRPFMKALWSDERFLASIQFEPLILVPRVLTNLLYSFLSILGLRFVDKLALCFYSHRIIEEHFNCDLTDILRRTVTFIVNRHKHRLASANQS